MRPYKLARSTGAHAGSPSTTLFTQFVCSDDEDRLQECADTILKGACHPYLAMFCLCVDKLLCRHADAFTTTVYAIKPARMPLGLNCLRMRDAAAPAARSWVQPEVSLSDWTAGAPVP